MDCETLSRLLTTGYEPGVQAEVDRHLAECPECRARHESQAALARSLAALRTEVASREAPAQVESALHAAFAQRRRRPRPWRRLDVLGLPLALAAALALVSWALHAPLPTVDPANSASDGLAAGPALRGEIGTAFFPLVPLRQIAQNTDTRVIEVSLPRTALASFGLPIDPERAAEPVAGEMLVSETGSPLAVRFILASATY
jgi:hypothetical protein